MPYAITGTNHARQQLFASTCLEFHKKQAISGRGRQARILLAILVTGGAGYIGSHAARALRRAGYEAVLYDNLSAGCRRLAQGFELIEGDIADHARLKRVLKRG